MISIKLLIIIYLVIGLFITIMTLLYELNKIKEKTYILVITMPFQWLYYILWVVGRKIIKIVRGK